jgi:hypothetical protein
VPWDRYTFGTQFGTQTANIGMPGRFRLFQLIDLIGGCTRTRTLDPLIKSQLLYQLSYAPAGRAL